MPAEWLLALGGLAAWAGLAQRTAREMDTLDDIEGEPFVNFSNGVQALGQAIARAEGFGTVNAIPTRAHNPGDLALGDVGFGTIGPERITIFSSDVDGWQALYKQLQLIADGRSHVYTRSMSLATMATHYAPGAQAVNWANNVAAILGVTPETPLNEILG